MHPDTAFVMSEEEARRFAAEVAFAHIFLARPDGPAVVHAPVVLEGGDRLVFHVARRNRALPIPGGTGAIASFGGPGAYVSPDWYVSAQQVPTWNYVAVEAEGRISALDDAELTAHLDALSAAQEARLAPKPAWTRDKMDPRRFDAMHAAILGFRLDVVRWRGTAKLSQNKPGSDIRGTIAGLRAAGGGELAERVEQANRDRLAS